jgi:L-fuculose-phosphate aldolase
MATQAITKGFSDNEWQLREEIVNRCRELNDRGINQGTSGNISARCGEGVLVSPSSFPYESMQPEHVVPMHFDDSYEGKLKPSSEWRFHLDILRARPEIQAVIHAHPMYCTTIAILGHDIPSLHYMIALTGGDTIRCAPYATFGTEALSTGAVEALGKTNACLLANHGVIVTGGNLGGAMYVLEEVETLAQQYFNTLQVGGPKLLSTEQMDDVRKAMMGGYGRARPRD